MKKALIILGVLAVASALFYFLFYNKKNALGGAKSSDQYDVDDTAAYNSVLALLSAADSGANAWVGPFVEERYKSNPAKIGGRPSKAQTFVDVMDQMSYNDKEGKFTNREGKKILWPQEMKDKMWANYLNPLKAKYTTL